MQEIRAVDSILLVAVYPNKSLFETIWKKPGRHAAVGQKELLLAALLISSDATELDNASMSC